jgi:signal transduction histidine kinase
MRSTKLAVSLVCLASAGIGLALGIVCFWFNLGLDQRANLGPELLKISVISVTLTAAILVLPVWLLQRRINRSSDELASALAERRLSSSEFPVVISPNRDPEYQRLVKEINGLIGVLKENQTRLDHYAAKVAHELRGPLTLLQLHLDHEAKELDPEFLGVMAAQVRRLTEYVDTALYVAKVKDHKIRVVKTRQKISKSIQEIAAPYALQAEAQHRKLTMDLSLEPEADLDEKIFGLILHNLFSNAMAHGLGEIRLRSRIRNGAVILIILNQVRTSANTETGTGIGLRTIESLAQAHSLKFSTRRIFNCYAATLLIPTLASGGAPVPQK